MYRLILCIALVLTACGGGGSDSSTTVATPATPSPQPSSTYSIAGAVTAATGGALPGVQLVLSGPAGNSTISDASGAFGFAGLSSGNYLVTPSASGQTFTPASATVNVQGLSISGVNFAQVAKSYPSTQLISDFMAIRHAQTLAQFAVDEKALDRLLAAQGGRNSGTHYTESGRNYVALVQAFATDSLAYVRTKSQTSPIDNAAVSALLATYANQDASYADTYYRDVGWGLSASGLSTFVAGIKKQTNDIYALTVLQLP